MANPYLNLYMNSPTAGGTDGTAISTDGTYTVPLTVTLNAAENESKKVKLAIRTQSGYETIGDTTISTEGDTNSRWGLSWLENQSTYTNSITTSSKITSTNLIFWVQASSSSDEAPVTDRSVSIKVITAIRAVD